MNQHEVALDTEGELTEELIEKRLTEKLPLQIDNRSSRKVKGTTTRNPTVVAIAKISAILDALDEPTRTSVADFIASEYSSV